MLVDLVIAQRYKEYPKHENKKQFFYLKNVQIPK